MSNSLRSHSTKAPNNGAKSLDNVTVCWNPKPWPRRL